jgi:hypothetical protein
MDIIKWSAPEIRATQSPIRGGLDRQLRSSQMLARALYTLEAAQCGTPHGAGWHVLAVENGTSRQLPGDEEDIVNKFRFGKLSAEQE